MSRNLNLIEFCLSSALIFTLSLITGVGQDLYNSCFTTVPQIDQFDQFQRYLRFKNLTHFRK